MKLQLNKKPKLDIKINALVLDKRELQFISKITKLKSKMREIELQIILRKYHA